MVTSKRKSLLFCAAAYLIAAVLSVLGARWVGGADLLFAAAIADLIATVVVFVGSVVVNNSSLYDPYWSVAPLCIAAYWLSLGAGLPLRSILVLGLLLAWGVRLTWNWAARWRGLSHEDWRYADYRKLGAPLYWAVSLLGFHLFPTVLVFMGCLSVYVVLVAHATGLQVLDIAAVLVTGAALLVEARADSELRVFLRSKPRAEEVLETGLWAWTRHPNYFGEVLFWWGLYLFGLAANPRYWWTIVGPLSITFLFLFVSVPMMERHMEAGHPGYAERKRLRSPFLPWPKSQPRDG